MPLPARYGTLPGPTAPRLGWVRGATTFHQAMAFPGGAVMREKPIPFFKELKGPLYPLPVKALDRAKAGKGEVGITSAWTIVIPADASDQVRMVMAGAKRRRRKGRAWK